MPRKPGEAEPSADLDPDRQTTPTRRRTSDVVPKVAPEDAAMAAAGASAGATGLDDQGVRRLFAASPVPMLLLAHRDGQLLFANKAARQTLGQSVETPGCGTSELFGHRSDQADLWASLSRVQSTDALEMQLRGEGGELFWALVSASAVQYRGQTCVMLGFSDLSAQKAAEHQLRFLAMRDPLTQAYNRHHFWQLAHIEMARVRRYDRPLSLAMVDADHFRRVNEAHGHDAGDLILKALVDTCQDALRKNDVLARYGGEELIILFPETDGVGAHRVMERLRERVERSRLRLTDGSRVGITVSVGVSGLRSREEDFEAVLKRADDALYLAKRGGRNRVLLG